MIKKDDKRVLWTDKPHNFLGLSINFTRYLLLQEKLIVRKGLLNVKDDEVMLYRIVDKKVERPLWQRIFKCGTLVLRAKDAYAPEIILKAVKQVDTLVDQFDSLIKESRDANRVVGREVLGTETEF